VPNAFGDIDKNPNQVIGTVHIEAPEFTSLCPITGQPDFGTIVIDYQPRHRCVESKSLKLYLGAFRQKGVFQENIVNTIANDLVTLLEPETLNVEGRFTARGGIELTPRASYQRNNSKG
jgi:7-cyano-7-deazaguanine reductase